MKVIHTDKAPAAVGPYVQAIGTEQFIFTSGQIPLVAETGELVSEIKAASKQCLENIKAVLNEAGVGLENVIKMTVYLDNIDDFAAMNEVYAEYFADHKPARSAIEVAALPKGAIVEMEAIASL